MFRRSARVFAGAAAAVSFFACTAQKSENPLSPTVAGPIPGVEISAPTPVEPGPGVKIALEQQPIALTIQNATSSGVRPLTYVFEVATDVNFATRVFYRTGVVPGEGRTQVRLPDRLAPERTDYWRANAEDGANTGPSSTSLFFNVFTPVVVGAPVLKEPINNTTVSTVQPVFRIGNAPRTGPAGSITYEIEVAEQESMAGRVGVWAIDEYPGDTNLTSPVALAPNKQYFWRARAFESTTSGPWAATQAFRTPAPVAPPLPPGPGGGCGGSSIYHVAPGALTEAQAIRILDATALEFSCLLAVFPTEDQALAAAEEFLLRFIWHLERAGFEADRQRNPSGLISKDKFTLRLDGAWRAFDIMTLGYGGVAGRIVWIEMFPPGPTAHGGIPD